MKLLGIQSEPTDFRTCMRQKNLEASPLLPTIENVITTKLFTLSAENWKVILGCFLVPKWQVFRALQFIIISLLLTFFYSIINTFAKFSGNMVAKNCIQFLNGTYSWERKCFSFALRNFIKVKLPETCILDGNRAPRYFTANCVHSTHSKQDG